MVTTRGSESTNTARARPEGWNRARRTVPTGRGGGGGVGEEDERLLDLLEDRRGLGDGGGGGGL